MVDRFAWIELISVSRRSLSISAPHRERRADPPTCACRSFRVILDFDEAEPSRTGTSQVIGEGSMNQHEGRKVLRPKQSHLPLDPGLVDHQPEATRNHLGLDGVPHNLRLLEVNAVEKADLVDDEVV